MKALFRKRLQGIFPDSEEGLKLLTKMPQGGLCMVEYVKSRNYENHKRFFKFVETAFDMQEQFEDPEIFRKHIQMLGGHFETVVFEKDGEAITQFWPKSIEFEKMDETEFQDLFSRCINAFLSRYGRDISEQEFMRVIDFD